MGLDAYVQCNCFREGKAKEPPFDAKLLTFNNNILDISHEVDDETFSAYIRWSENACEHEDFKLVYERVGNASGMNFFWDIINKIGEEQFPNFSAMWKKSHVESQLAERVIKEIAVIKSKIKDVKAAFLIDEDTNEEYCSVVEGDDTWFYSHGGEFNYRLGDRGFYITDRNAEILFISQSFSQDVKVMKGNREVEVYFQDILTGKTYKSSKAIERCINWQKEEFYYPDKLIVKKRNLEIDDCYTLQVLERLLETSIITGNPIVWA